VATALGAKRLWDAGADMLRVGVGNGSICTTRIETGNGVPQLTALMDIHSIKQEMENKLGKQLLIVNDGGVTKVGDIVKALCFSDFVMTGNMFAGCEEAPGSIISVDGKMYKSYVGSSTHKTTRIEGVEAMVPLKKDFKSILTKMIEGIQSGCSYQNAHNLEELKDNPQFVKISSAGLKESHAHDVTIVKK
jgi:IMP dehydrogenase